MDRGQLFGKNMSDEMVKMFAEEDMEHMNAGNGFGVGTLGSGSDYTVFLQRIGVSSQFLLRIIPYLANPDCKFASWIRINTLRFSISLPFCL